VIGAAADLHFNVCNQEDREDEELVYTEKCRIWPENLKWAAPAIKVLDACEYCDAAVIIGDVLDYLSRGALSFTKSNLFAKYPEFMVAVGGHDYTKQMQTKLPDLLPLEERLDMIRAVWPHDIHYYSRDLTDKITAVILDNSQSKYLPCQIEPLGAEIERARKEGRAILVFQHEPMVSKNPEETLVTANIVNSGAIREVNIGFDKNMVGGECNCDEVTACIYGLITENSDVVKAVFAGHWHSQFYSEIITSYKENGRTVKTLTPQYIISGNPYHEAGALAKIMIK